MIVEGHWRKLKHDFLHRFSRPRIDLVAWIVTSRVIPDVIDRMKAIQNGVFRKHKAGWRLAFKKEWKMLEGRDVSAGALTKYHTDPYKWICACPAFLESRFLTCKHIIHCYEPIVDPLTFFESVQRQRTSPFWNDQQLVLRPEYLRQESQNTVLGDINATDSMIDPESNSESEGDSEALEEDIGPDEDSEPMDARADGFITMMQSVVDLFQEQRAKGNDKFLDKVIAANESNRTLLTEIEQLRTKRTMPMTWGPRRHPATMYYK
jgi:hypothetical protein